MVDGENNRRGVPDVDNDLAKDVANLYSWANVEGVPYRDFSRQRRRIRHATDVDIRKSEEVIAPEADIEGQAQELHSPVVLPTEESVPLPAPATSAVAELPQSRIEVPPSYSEPNLQSRMAGPPSFAVYSLAGGVGKTTLCANLGRLFCSMKEKVLLVDASGSGLLPFYFGATDLRCGLRTFVSPDANYPPLQVIGADVITKDWLEGDVKVAMRKVQRTIFDLGPASTGLLPEILSLCGTILVPMLPDLNSILTISRIENSLKAMQSAGMEIPECFYLFNQFDPRDSIDQRARALVERQCRGRLLPLTIRDGAEVVQAIASRMTVADHAPGSAVTHDYLELASWLRKRSPVRGTTRTQARWSER